MVVGFTALSGGLHLGLGLLELHETGALAEIDELVREARSQAPTFLLVLLAMGIAPGFGEEMLFRGMLLSRLVRMMPPMWAVVAQAFLFAAIHLLDPSAIAALPLVTMRSCFSPGTGTDQRSLTFAMPQS